MTISTVTRASSREATRAVMISAVLRSVREPGPAPDALAALPQPERPASPLILAAGGRPAPFHGAVEALWAAAGSCSRPVVDFGRVLDIGHGVKEPSQARFRSLLTSASWPGPFSGAGPRPGARPRASG